MLLRPRENDFGDDLWSQGLLSPVQLFLELLCPMPNFCLEPLLAVWIQIQEGALGELSLIGVDLDFVQERRVVCCLLLERRCSLLSADRSFFFVSSKLLGQPPDCRQVAAAPLMRQCLKSPNGRRVDLSGSPRRWHCSLSLSSPAAG